MKTLAAVLVETGKPLELIELEIPTLKAGQVLVEIAASGVCHTQVLECRGHRGEDRYLPHCLGHEGSGTVVETGPDVTRVESGDPVILSWIKGSGADVPGTTYDWGGTTVNAGAITTFMKYSIISENRLTVMADKLSMPQAALLGCAVPTGVGAVYNAGEARSGQSVALFGLGGVGLMALNGARAAGCEPIIAVDILDTKLDVARAAGATHCINASNTNPVEAIKDICPNGVDLAVEASGVPQVMSTALCSVRNQGGRAVIIGNAQHGQRIELDPWQLNLGKQLRGTWGGDSNPNRDYPHYMKLVIDNKIDLTPLLGKTYPLEQINRAIDDLESGRVMRPLILM